MSDDAAPAWRPIGTAPKDGTDVLVFVDCASVPIVRLAWWDDGGLYAEQGYDSPEETRGWWSCRHSVTQEMLDGPLEPTRWMPVPAPFPLDAGSSTGQGAGGGAR